MRKPHVEKRVGDPPRQVEQKKAIGGQWMMGRGVSQIQASVRTGVQGVTEGSSGDRPAGSHRVKGVNNGRDDQRRAEFQGTERPQMKAGAKRSSFDQINEQKR